MKNKKRQQDPFYTPPTHALNKRYEKPGTPRRRVHDVVIWQENDEWVVYDAPTNSCYRFETEDEAVQKFKDIKAKFTDAEKL